MADTKRKPNCERCVRQGTCTQLSSYTEILVKKLGPEHPSVENLKGFLGPKCELYTAPGDSAP